MKNLKKVLALVVVFAMMISTVAFASYPDVDTTADYAGAVELLSALDILKGDDQGNFNPENTITRAEFAAVVCRALGLENSANSAKGATAFTDVAADHWASGYINLASQQKIVNGRGNGIFDPNGNVTFAEAVKMLVVALGYEPMASQRGGYPTGYLTVANSTKLTANVSAGGTNTAALRKTVAMLTANALEIPMMDQTGFGSDVTFEVLDDYDNYQTLLTNRDIYVATGVVGDTDKEEGTVNFKFSDASDDYEFGYNKKGEVKEALGEDDFVIADSNIEEYYQQNVKAYVYKASKSEYEVLIAVPSGIGSTLTLDVKDIEAGELGTESKAVEYYATAEATKTTKIYVDKDYVSYVNGVEVKVADLAVFAGKDAVVEFVENTDDKYYDRVLVTVYENAIVEKVDADEPEFSRITLVNNDKIDLDLEDEDLIINIVDKDGNAMDLADFAQYDVLSIVVGELEKNDKNENTTTPVEAKNFNEEITIINLGQSSVTGSITEASEEYIYIDDAEYEVGAFVDGNASEVFDDVKDITTAKLATEGVFFISATGKIIGFDGEAAANSDYGYILEAYYQTTGFASSRTWEVSMLTAEGINTYELYSTVSVNGKKAEQIKSDNEFFKAYEAAKHNEKVNTKIVEFKLTSDGKIKAISAFAIADTDLEEGVEYKAASNKLDSNRLSANTIIFDITKTKAEDCKATDISSLVDEGKYDGYLVDKKNNEYKLFVMTAGSAAFDAEAPLMFVDSVRKSTYGSEDAVTVKYITDGSKTVADAIFVTGEAEAIYSGADFTNLSKGDVFLANINAEGLVAEYAVLAQLTEKEGVFDLAVDADVLKKLNAADEDVQFMYGKIAKIDEEDITTTDNVDFAETLTLSGGFNEYQFNTRIKTPAVQLSSWDRNGVTVDYPVFIKLFDGEVIDIYTVTNLVESVESVE